MNTVHRMTTEDELQIEKLGKMLNDRSEALDHMSEAVYAVQHNRKVVDPSDELAEKIVDLIFSGYNSPVIDAYVELVVKP